MGVSITGGNSKSESEGMGFGEVGRLDARGRCKGSDYDTDGPCFGKIATPLNVIEDLSLLKLNVSLLEFSLHHLVQGGQFLCVPLLGLRVEPGGGPDAVHLKRVF